MMTADIVICGAGIAGISAAYHLSLRRPSLRILLVDQGAPLCLTSDKSTEAYRNWWPGPDDAMVRLMNRSIDLLEELARSCGNAFRMNRRGYLYVTADPSRAEHLLAAAEQAAGYGAGPIRLGIPPMFHRPRTASKGCRMGWMCSWIPGRSAVVFLTCRSGWWRFSTSVDADG